MMNCMRTGRGNAYKWVKLENAFRFGITNKGLKEGIKISALVKTTE